jgi:hypothetical protein
MYCANSFVVNHDLIFFGLMGKVALTPM